MRLLSTIFAALTLASGLLAQAPVQPWSCASPSGEFELFVDPSSRLAAGPARCRLNREGKPLWEREVPFTFLDALLGDDGCVLVSEAGEILRSHERAPNGRWLEELWASAVDEDGTLAVLDVPMARSLAPWSTSASWVHLFAADGEPLRSRELPEGPDLHFGSGSTLAIHDGLVAVLEGGQILFLAPDGASLGRTRVPEDVLSPGDSFHGLFFSPSGGELWIFPHGQPAMVRFLVSR